MLVTLSGIVIDVKLLQLVKALEPILVTLDGITMEVKLEQLAKAALLMLVTLSGIVIFVAFGLHLTAVVPLIHKPLS